MISTLLSSPSLKELSLESFEGEWGPQLLAGLRQIISSKIGPPQRVLVFTTYSSLLSHFGIITILREVELGVLVLQLSAVEVKIVLEDVAEKKIKVEEESRVMAEISAELMREFIMALTQEEDVLGRPVRLEPLLPRLELIQRVLTDSVTCVVDYLQTLGLCESSSTEDIESSLTLAAVRYAVTWASEEDPSCPACSALSLLTPLLGQVASHHDDQIINNYLTN
eukprot:TRINITY_DN6052_c0_g1_i1.p1 TRINITY_DN6052_c0_g1~~TRINITY_DN6052_c0_g1_i1.p1  ORF type:complete len:224 (+),score=45.60 TRINITY_DN6052_c0_g1_i1:2-673(+)